MTLGGVLGIVGVALVIIIFVMFPEARSLAKGFTRLFIKDVASTPEGARAIYAEKIDKLQEVYNKADDSYKLASGKLETAKTELGELQKRLQKVTAEAESLYAKAVHNNDSRTMELARLKADERTDIIEQIANVDDMITKYQKATDQAQLIHEQAEKALKKTKREAKETVQRMKDNENLAELYNNLDELKNTDGVDKLIDAVKDRDKELAQIAAGSSVVHQNKLETKLGIAEKEAYRLETSDFLDSLAAKYDKKAIPIKK